MFGFEDRRFCGYSDGGSRRDTLADPESTVVRSSRHDVAGVGYPARSGLVISALAAYSGHYEIVPRSDDVWQAPRNSPRQRNLEIAARGTLFTTNPCTAHFGKQLFGQIQDSFVAKWLLPAITTAAEEHCVAAPLSKTVTLQAHFGYNFTLSDFCSRPHKNRSPAGNALLASVLDSFVRSADGEPRMPSPVSANPGSTSYWTRRYWFGRQ